MNFKSYISIILSLLLWVSCAKNPDKDNAAHKVRVMSSFSIITDMVEQIGRDAVEVHNLVPVGKAPHNYELTPSDIKFGTRADLFIYNGLNLEGGETGWFAKMLQSLKVDPQKVFSVTEEITPQYLLGKEGARELNPHAFINPEAGLKMAKAIEKALIAVNPEREDFYRANAEEYIGQLTAVEQQYRQQFGSIPKEERVFMASEQAFQYLLDEYDFKGGYIWAIDTDENGSPEQIKKAIAFVEQNHPRVLFVESNVDLRPMKTVAQATGVPVYMPPVYSDELGKKGSEADTYLKYLQYNLQHIYKGLTGAEINE